VKRLEEYASGDFSLEELLVRVSDQFLRELGEKAAGPIVAQTEWHPSIDVLQLGVVHRPDGVLHWRQPVRELTDRLTPCIQVADPGNRGVHETFARDAVTVDLREAREAVRGARHHVLPHGKHDRRVLE
jgi:hypothetical protein